MEAIIKTRKNKAVGRMTNRQIEKKVGEAWAILANPVYDEKQVLLSAELLYFNADKEKVLVELSKCKKGHFAMFFFGTMDPNIVYLL